MMIKWIILGVAFLATIPVNYAILGEPAGHLPNWIYAVSTGLIGLRLIVTSLPHNSN